MLRDPNDINSRAASTCRVRARSGDRTFAATWRRSIFVWLAASLSAILLGPGASGASARESTIDLDVRVLVVRGDVVEIDVGASSGAMPGDVVVLRPLGRAEMTGRVRTTRDKASIVYVSGGTAGLSPGVPGVLRVPEGRLASLAEGADSPSTDEQLPVAWSRHEGPWENGAPLLAEVTSPLPDERPSIWRGRGTVGAFLLVDNGALPRQDRIGWLGLDLRGQNPFGRGGEMNIAFEVRANDLSYDDPALEGDSSSFLRVDRLSYAWGGTRDAPLRFEVGRFLSREFPELGFIGGLEASYRTTGGMRFGALSGFQPALDAKRSFQDAPQVALWGAVPFGAENQGDVGLALQKTWFEGAQDRDLMIGRGRWTDGPWRFDASVWVDGYGADDPGKSSGLELTEARAGMSRMIGARSGVRLDASRIRFPSLRRHVNQSLSIERLENAAADTINLSAWMPAGRNGRWNARAGAWENDDDNGGWVEFGHAHDLGGDAFRRWSLDAFLSNDPLNDVVGGRGRISGGLRGGTWSLSLDVGSYDRSQELNIGDEFQSAIRAVWNGEIADRWFLQVDLTDRLGSEQNAYSLNLSLSRSL